MGRTGRICAALLTAASLALPGAAQDRSGQGLHGDPPLEPSYDYEENTGLATDLELLEQAHAAYMRKLDLQRERPETEPEDIPPPKPPPNWLVSIMKFLSQLAPLFTWLFYIVCGLGVLGLLYFLFGEAVRIRFGGDGREKGKTGDDVIADFRPEAGAARSLLEEADALARAGKFAEAVHLLLFRSIEDIQTRLEGGVPRSMTAREIGTLGYLPDRARSALGPIIAIVERSFFGGRDVDEGGWKTARASYEDFAFGGDWS